MDVLDLADAEALDLVGGKARSLGRLIRAGFDVPDGFCVTTQAYGRVVEVRIGAAAAAAAHDDELPGGLRDAILERYRALGPGIAVAVRSSATAEDLPDASFAGQQDTFLNVVGEAAVIDAVRRCWASLWTERAVAYRDSIGLDPRSVALAVVVQRMVDATVAGVLFTANPITGTRTEMTIDAHPGLGEAVVSGAVNPEHLVVDTTTGRVLDRRPGDAGPCLSDDQVAALVEVGRRVQDLAGSPQDIEWAIDANGRLRLTQARPVTTLYPVPTSTRPGLRVFLCVTLAQGLTRPITPLGLAAYRRMGSGVLARFGAPPADVDAGPVGFVAAGQRQFVDITPVLSRPGARRIALRIAGVMEARTRTVLADLARDGRIPADTGGSLLPTVARVLWITKLPLKLAAGLVDPRLAYRGMVRAERRLRDRLAIDERATPGQRLDFVERRLATDTFLLMPRTFPYAAGGFVALALARRLLRGVADPAELESRFQVVLRGLPHNVTTEMDLELWALATRIRREPATAAAFEADPAAVLADFTARYGHRAVAEIDLGMPRWSERPEHLIGAVRNYLQAGDDRPAPDVAFAHGAAEGEAAVTELTMLAARRSRLRGRMVGWSLARVRALTGLREYPKFLLVLSLARLRAQLLLVGAAAVEAGSLDAAEEVSWLDLRELRRALNGERLTELVAERRTAYERELRRRHVPRILLSDGTEPEATRSPGHGADGLVGSPASTGVVTGVARVVLDPTGARLESGEILVAPSTDPGWTPLFLTAGGLVMEMGGSNSHGAVVAREYGIPAVVGLPRATELIETGQTITVDGAAGVVVIEADGGQ